MGGACVIASCNPGWADCDGNPANGCEVNTQTSVGNCGGCGNACSVPNGTAACVAGACAVGGCNTGYANCNGMVSDGCEVNTTTNVNNCGACGNVCSVANGTPTCNSGVCSVGSCNAGFEDCNKQVADGCEINTANDTKNCGGCNNQCFVANGAPGCSSGACTVKSCNAGFGNCDGNVVNGCETNTNTDVTNCGTCGNNCTSSCTGNVSSTTCSAGSCAITSCNATYYNIDGICGNGCECKSSGTSNSCNMPTALGTVNLGQSVNYTGNLVPAGQEAWLAVTFTGNTNTTYHPRIRFTTNPNNEFQFDVLTNCSGGAMACGTEGGTSVAITEWETSFTNAPSSGTGYTNVIPPVGVNGTILIRVFRKIGAGLSCNNYTLTISN